MNYNYFVFNKVTGEKVKSFCTMWQAFDYASDLNDKAELKVYSISRGDGRMTTTQAFTLSHNLAFVQQIQHKLYRVGKDKWNVVIIGEKK